MRRCWDRGQFEPVVALLAVLTISAGLVIYAETLEETLPGEADREIAGTVVDRIGDRLRVAGAADPARLDHALGAVPDRWEVNLTLRTTERTWRRGPVPGADAMAAKKHVTVRVGPADLHPATLRVVIWR